MSGLPQERAWVHRCNQLDGQALLGCRCAARREETVEMLLHGHRLLTGDAKKIIKECTEERNTSSFHMHNAYNTLHPFIMKALMF